MTATLLFEFPRGWLLTIPLAAALAFVPWRQRKRGLPRSRVLLLASLRAVALSLLVFLAARPVWLAREPPASAARSVALLMDRSESMSLEECFDAEAIHHSRSGETLDHKEAAKAFVEKRKPVFQNH